MTAVLSATLLVTHVTVAVVCVILVICRFEIVRLVVGGGRMIGGAALTGVMLAFAPDDTLPPASIANMV